MKEQKAHTIPLADLLENINSYNIQAMNKYYSKGGIGGSSNLAMSDESISRELVDCLRARNCSQSELP
ncbi:hypothetical protein IV02_08070 [Pseudomonas syringae]|uniref:Uncharacterized protein n=1 Tax=Pseudomonas syringae TaxID=317 RepID=A0A085VAC7_PSESX|nr:hypothetical protein IV02_08070 [Pseudomonas syringae]